MRCIALALALVITGCQGASQPAGTVGMLPAAIVPAHSQALLYVSSLDGAISAFTYPQGRLAGKLTSNYGSAGLCSDKAGNVYVAVPEAYLVEVFPHGGLFPIYILNEEQEEALPYACAADGNSGDLAVTNLEGGVEIYKDARGTPQGYSLAGLDEAFFATYDDKGNLFVTGQHGGTFILAELAKGSQSSKDISIAATIAPGYGIAWNGKDLVLQSAQSSGTATMLTVKVSGSRGTVLRTTTLTASPNYSPTEFVLDANTIVEPDSDNADVGFWAYPAGGAQTKSLQNVGSGLIGVTVSR
jgi:hypothetical protein